ncbi:hypothetical protein [Rubritalea marina]|uniref:hypothetical protein n=1 Tax=Rubritalea marina TaxID=361055 RepID=UPI00037760DE|nr:hypothetical protein [Rubritalea marina]
MLSTSEQAAWRNLEVQRMIAQCEFPAVRELFQTRWIDRSPEIEALLSSGPEHFFNTTCQRLESQLNRCPACGTLCRTARARQCPSCPHTWFDSAR